MKEAISNWYFSLMNDGLPPAGACTSSRSAPIMTWKDGIIAYTNVPQEEPRCSLQAGATPAQGSLPCGPSD